MSKLLINIPDDLLEGISKVSENRSDFIIKAIKEKLEKEMEQLLIEGYSKEKNLDEWDITISDGV